jgi:hypothetical protein
LESVFKRPISSVRWKENPLGANAQDEVARAKALFNAGLAVDF